MGLAIAGLTCISSAIGLLSSIVPAEISLLNFLFIISTFVILLGCSCGLTFFNCPAIALSKAGISEEQAQKALEAVKDFVVEQFPMMAGAVENLLGAKGTDEDDDIPGL